MDVHDNSDAANLAPGGPARVLSDSLRSAVAMLILTAALQVVADRGEDQDALADAGDYGTTDTGRS